MTHPAPRSRRSRTHWFDARTAWHADVLAARRRKIESGEAEFLSIEESEALLERECTAR